MTVTGTATNSFKNGDLPSVSQLKIEYLKSKPFKHAVVKDLLDEEIALKIRNEILTNLEFTEKETDIYRVKHKQTKMQCVDSILGKFSSDIIL